MSNSVYLHPDDFKNLFPTPDKVNYVQLRDLIFTADSHPDVGKESIGLSSVQRIMLSIALKEKVEVSIFHSEAQRSILGMVNLKVDFYTKRALGPDETFDYDEIRSSIKKATNNFYLNSNQKFLVESSSNVFLCQVIEVDPVNAIELTRSPSNSKLEVKSKYGRMVENTLVLLKSDTLPIISMEAPSENAPVAQSFANLPVGGMDQQIKDIFRRAFLSRLFPPSLLSALGVKHVRGVLLHGPPGCGKTLLARQIGKILTGKEPKVVNGPEVLDPFVGKAESNIRDLFKEAEAEYKLKRDNSGLHVIIFDEIDALCKKRGSTNDSTRVGDSIVNQLLSKIDGVNQLNNILIIGMTNRLDLLDEALLRPGRIEVLVEVGLPDEAGRVQILEIHTKAMAAAKILDPEVELHTLAKLTKNFTGSELEGVVRAASSFALQRALNVNETQQSAPKDIHVHWSDFEHALKDVKPAFAVNETEIKSYIRNGIIYYGTNFESIISEGNLLIDQVKTSEVTPLVTVLLNGNSGAGKTAIAATLAMESGFPFVKVLSPDTLVGLSEPSKCSIIYKTFMDAYKSTLSCIVVDDIERLLEYAPIGPRFSNAILQTLLVFLKRSPPEGCRLIVFGTSSNLQILEDLQLAEVFDNQLSIPNLTNVKDIKKILVQQRVFDDTELDLALPMFEGKSVPVRKLLMIGENVKKADTRDARMKRLAHLLSQLKQ